MTTHRIRDDGKLLCIPHTAISVLLKTTHFDSAVTCAACLALLPRRTQPHRPLSRRTP